MQLQNYEWVQASYDDVQLSANARNGTPLGVATFTENAETYPTVKPTDGNPAFYGRSQLLTAGSSITSFTSTPRVYYKKPSTLTAGASGTVV